MKQRWRGGEEARCGGKWRCWVEAPRSSPRRVLGNVSLMTSRGFYSIAVHLDNFSSDILLPKGLVLTFIDSHKLVTAQDSANFDAVFVIIHLSPFVSR